jgi:hypothetical protein
MPRRTGETVDWQGRWPVAGSRSAASADLDRRQWPARLERVGKWFNGWFQRAGGEFAGQ